MYDARCYVMLSLQALLNSTSQIDKAYIYTFLWPWLGSGLLTSTGKKIQPLSVNFIRVTEPLLATVSKVNELLSSTSGKIIEPYSGTAI